MKTLKPFMLLPGSEAAPQQVLRSTRCSCSSNFKNFCLTNCRGSSLNTWSVELSYFEQGKCLMTEALDKMFSKKAFLMLFA